LFKLDEHNQVVALGGVECIFLQGKWKTMKTF